MCGTGLYGWNSKEEEGHIFKRALAGADFVNTHQFDAYKNLAKDFDLVIGHNRASTIGSAKDSNCHPFQFGDITLVHNGTLNYYSELDRSFNHSVDSAHAANAINKLGAIPALERIRGAFVFVWHNSKTKTFHMARNSMRDIWYIVDKEGETLYYASEYSMLHWLLERNKLEIANEKYRSLVEHTMYTWDLGKSLRKPRIQKFKEAPSHPSYGEHNWGGRPNNRDADELEEYSLRQFQYLKIDNPVFYKYGDRSQEGRIEGTATLKNKKGEAVKVITKAHSIREVEWDKIKNGPVEQCITSVWEDNGTPVIVARHVRAVIPPTPVVQALPSPKRPQKEDGDATDAELDNFFRGPQNRLISKEEFAEYIKPGCCYCSSPIKFADEKDITWINVGNDHEPLCKTCSSDRTIKKELMGYYGRFMGDD